MASNSTMNGTWLNETDDYDQTMFEVSDENITDEENEDLLLNDTYYGVRLPPFVGC